MVKIYKGLNLDCLYAWGYFHLEIDRLLHNNCKKTRRRNIAEANHVEVTTTKSLSPTPHVQYPLTFKISSMILLSEGEAAEAW